MAGGMVGFKTYIIAGLMAAASLTYGLGFIDATIYGTIMGILNGGGFAALRSGVNTEVAKVETAVEAIPSVVTPQHRDPTTGQFRP